MAEAFGQRVTKYGDSASVPNGASVGGKAQVSGNTTRVGIQTAGPGAYHVHWQALSVDTHKTQGSFTFTVGAK